MAMLMTYLKGVAETALSKPVGDCVISVSPLQQSAATITMSSSSNRYHPITLMPNVGPY